jgi:hypothetical protein
LDATGVVGFAAAAGADGLDATGVVGFAAAAGAATVDAARGAGLRGFAGFAGVRFAAAFLRGVERPVGTVPAFAVAAAPFAAVAGVVAAVADFGPPGAPGFVGLVPGVREGGGTVASSSPPRSRPAAPRPTETALRPSPTAESITLRGVRDIRAVCPQRSGLCGEGARSVRRARGHDARAAAGDREGLGGREALPDRAARRKAQRARHPPRQRVEVEAELQLAREEVLSSLPRGVHFGQYFRGRAAKEVVNERGARHQVEVFRRLERLTTEMIGALPTCTHGVGTPSRYSPAG